MLADENNKVLQRGRMIGGKKVDYEQESFMVEVHTIGGYSGSPVFVYFPGWYDIGGTTKEYLLGVHWGSIPIHEPVVDKDGTKLKQGWQVEYSTGMGGVVPAWHLYDLLMNDEDLKMQRKEQDKKTATKKKTERNLRAGRLESAPESMTKSAFDDALKKASRKTSEPESRKTQTSE
jgi:hypothetical protein